MDDVKHAVDAGAAVTTIAAIMHLMPEVAALLTSVWYVIRLVEWAKSKLRNNGDE